MTPLSRRRFLAVAGAAAAGGLMGFPASGRSRDTYVWRGVALGAPAEIRIDIGDRESAAAIVARCRNEIVRLEHLFSLYVRDSALNRLNRDGHLDAPDADLVALLTIARSVHRATGGAFDPTIQPHWARLARHHSGQGDDRWSATVTGFDHVAVASDRIAFARPGMALTLNGIAQGYITDRVADLLRSEGVDHTLVNVGEMRALGGRSDGSSWPVRLAGGGLVALEDRALATSDAAGTTFDAEGRVSHILDPKTGRPAPIGRQVSVEAQTAALADALSTGLVLLPPEAAADIAASFAGVRVVG